MEAATIKEEWPVKQWNPHDDFMFIILSACLRFLGRHCPPHLFEYDRCLRAAQGNINLQMMLHFVYDCGLPYLILRKLHPEASHCPDSQADPSRLQRVHAPVPSERE